LKYKTEMLVAPSVSITPRAQIVDPPDLLEAEDVLVEGSLFSGIPAGDREMPDPGHDLSFLREVSCEREWSHGFKTSARPVQSNSDARRCLMLSAM
jgi:hypothetical protein